MKYHYTNYIITTADEHGRLENQLASLLPESKVPQEGDKYFLGTVVMVREVSAEEATEYLMSITDN